LFVPKVRKATSGDMSVRAHEYKYGRYSAMRSNALAACTVSNHTETGMVLLSMPITIPTTSRADGARTAITDPYTLCHVKKPRYVCERGSQVRKVYISNYNKVNIHSDYKRNGSTYTSCG
jgi:hypothetical protein